MARSTNQNDNQSLYYRYFIYSAEEEALRIKIHGPQVPFGTVIVRGVPKRYTSIVSDRKDIKPDGIILIKGDIKKIKYTTPSMNVGK
jgi:hypothetical protein